MTSGLPAEIRRWVRDEPLDVTTRVRFRNLANEIQRLDVMADKSATTEAFAAIRDLCENVDTGTEEALQGWLAASILAVLDAKDSEALS